MSLSKIKIQKTAKNLIGHFDPKAKFEIAIREETWRINIETEASPLLIGRHGQTLQALEHLLRLMLAQETEEFMPITLDIAGYRAAREEEITRLALEAVKRVLATGESEFLPLMPSFERRLVHLALAEIDGVETESVGQEPERKIVIKKRELR